MYIREAKNINYKHANQSDTFSTSRNAQLFMPRHCTSAIMFLERTTIMYVYK